jgi:acetyl-CoA synthetase
VPNPPKLTLFSFSRYDQRPLPGAIPTKPGSATLPFFGIEPTVLDTQTGKPIEENNVEGVLAIKQHWPSIARTIYGDHKRYKTLRLCLSRFEGRGDLKILLSGWIIRFLETYLKPYPGHYFTGDGVSRDSDGYYWIKGRVDDVINVSGHRLSTAEIEAALIHHPATAECAAVGVNDEMTGQAVFAFVTLKPEYNYDPEREDDLVKELVLQVRKNIGPFAAPKKMCVSS